MNIIWNVWHKAFGPLWSTYGQQVNKSKTKVKKHQSMDKRLRKGGQRSTQVNKSWLKWTEAYKMIKVSRHNKNPTSEAYSFTYLHLFWDFTINVSLQATMMPNHHCAVSIYIDLSFSSHLHYVIKNVEDWESLSRAFYLCVNTPCQQQWPPKLHHSTSNTFKVNL